MDPFNGLSAGEAERLSFLIEELAEAQQAACKILRHGYESRNPDDKREGEVPNNRENLTKELGDVQAALDLMAETADIDLDCVTDYACDKAKSMQRWMHHQEF